MAGDKGEAARADGGVLFCEAGEAGSFPEGFEQGNRCLTC